MTPEKSIKVPSVLYRQGTSELQQDGTIRLSISSDRPYLRYDWWNDEEYYEKLDHDPQGCDLTRITAGTALLFNHDRDIHLGLITQPELGGGKCHVAGKISEAPDVESYRTRIKEGILKDSSVGYELIDDGVDDGEIDGIPVYRFKWRPFEASLVTIPADISVGVGRERDLEKPKGEPREIRIREKTILNPEKIKFDNPPDKSQKRENGEPLMPPTAEPKEKTQAELDQEKRERDEFLKAERLADRERQKEIRAIAKHGKNVPEEVVTKAIDDETTADEFRKLVFEKYFGTAETVDTPSGHGNGDIRVIGERSKSIGSLFVGSEAFKRAVKGKGQGERNASVDIPFPILGIRGKANMAQRAGFTSSDIAAINVAPQQQLVALGVQRLTIMDLIAPGTTDKAAIPYPRENSFGTVDGVAVAAGAMPRGKSVGERGVKPTWEPDLTTETANVKKIAVLTKVPDEFMMDFPGMQSYIDERLPFMVDIETEAQILYGDGLGNNLKGITSTAQIQTRAYATAWGDTTLKALTDIRVNSFFEPDGFAFHPYDWEVARLEKDLNGQYLAGGPFYIPYGNGVFQMIETFWGKPVAVTTSVAVGKPIAACWRLGAQYFIREGMRLETTNANEDDFKRNLIAIRAEHRLALAVYRPVAFLEITGGPART